MSQPAILAAVETRAASITGVVATLRGWPQGQPYLGGVTVAVYLDPGPVLEKRLTNGAGGTIEVKYGVMLRAILGPLDMDAAAAEVAAALYLDRFRADFWADQTLGGVCQDSQLSTGRDNCPTFRRDQVEPALFWRLAVTEHIAANAAPQT